MRGTGHLLVRRIELDHGRQFEVEPALGGKHSGRWFIRLLETIDDDAGAVATVAIESLTGGQRARLIKALGGRL
jgi:hypothetical protein